MKRFLNSLAFLSLLTVIGCGQELSPKNPLLIPPPTPVTPPVLFEDFEKATPLTRTAYGASTSPVSSWDNTTSVSPSHSWKLVVTTTSWGGGFNIYSNYGTLGSYGYQVINALGKANLSYWIRSDTAITGYSVRFRQAGNAATYQDFNWVSPNQNAPATSTWQNVVLPVSGFTQDANADAGCAPNCGGGIKNLAQIEDFEIQFPGGLNNANVWIDDIKFQ